MIKKFKKKSRQEYQKFLKLKENAHQARSTLQASQKIKIWKKKKKLKNEKERKREVKKEKEIFSKVYQEECTTMLFKEKEYRGKECYIKRSWNMTFG